jgi:hypothetical protein
MQKTGRQKTDQYRMNCRSKKNAYPDSMPEYAFKIKC